MDTDDERLEIVEEPCGDQEGPDSPDDGAQWTGSPVDPQPHSPSYEGAGYRSDEHPQSPSEEGEESQSEDEQQPQSPSEKAESHSEGGQLEEREAESNSEDERHPQSPQEAAEYHSDDQPQSPSEEGAETHSEDEHPKSPQDHSQVESQSGDETVQSEPAPEPMETSTELESAQSQSQSESQTQSHTASESQPQSHVESESQSHAESDSKQDDSTAPASDAEKSAVQSDTEQPVTAPAEKEPNPDLEEGELEDGELEDDDEDEVPPVAAKDPAPNGDPTTPEKRKASPEPEKPRKHSLLNPEWLTQKRKAPDTSPRQTGGDGGGYDPPYGRGPEHDYGDYEDELVTGGGMGGHQRFGKRRRMDRGPDAQHLETAPKEILGDFPRMTRPDANQVIDAAAAKRKDNIEPDFSFPNMEQTRKAHLINSSFDPRNLENDLSVRSANPLDWPVTERLGWGGGGKDWNGHDRPEWGVPERPERPERFDRPDRDGRPEREGRDGRDEPGGPRRATRALRSPGLAGEAGATRATGETGPTDPTDPRGPRSRKRRRDPAKEEERRERRERRAQERREREERRQHRHHRRRGERDSAERDRSPRHHDRHERRRRREERRAARDEGPPSGAEDGDIRPVGGAGSDPETAEGAPPREEHRQTRSRSDERTPVASRRQRPLAAVLPVRTSSGRREDSSDRERRPSSASREPTGADARGPRSVQSPPGGQESEPPNMDYINSLPASQRQLYLRIHQHQKEHVPREDTPQPTEEDEDRAADDNWYSSDEEDAPPLTAVLKQISSAEDERSRRPSASARDVDERDSRGRRGSWRDERRGSDEPRRLARARRTGASVTHVTWILAILVRHETWMLGIPVGHGTWMLEILVGHGT
ncbi:hypothetical protein FJT64_000101 [Amphibalanus amphitrite]|uniref:Uncharacterized protein n=1 Tax=Amphibalanus amphitrite TaxID=1232801 RepID=A0A6A4WE51_AMPAM|nr:hypothetical protein FJT64_000101 [Amphibalanus amphitrite]